MGIFTDAIAIILGGLFGGKLQKRNNTKSQHVLGVGIMIVSLVGFLENVYNVRGEHVVSENLILILLSYFIGSKIGDALRIEDRLSTLNKTANKAFNSFIDATLFFGVGGLQISGPILLALHNDNTQLIIKSMVDLPFAVAFGAAYGKVVSVSAVPVAVIQILIAVIAYSFSSFFSNEMIAQVCAMGYIILFFSGFNLMTDGKYKINNINMLPGIVLVILFNVLTGVMERI